MPTDLTTKGRTNRDNSLFALAVLAVVGLTAVPAIASPALVEGASVVLSGPTYLCTSPNAFRFAEYAEHQGDAQLRSELSTGRCIEVPEDYRGSACTYQGSEDAGIALIECVTDSPAGRRAQESYTSLKHLRPLRTAKSTR
jgi:hypothetical protein